MLVKDFIIEEEEGEGWQVEGGRCVERDER